MRAPVPTEPDSVVRARSATRARVLGGLLTVGMVALMGRGAAIMLFPDPQLEDQARNQFRRAQVIEGRRGDILSRDGEFLATSVEVQSLHIDHSRLTEETAALVAAQVAPLVDATAEEILADYRAEPNRMDLRLARDLPVSYTHLTLPTICSV